MPLTSPLERCVGDVDEFVLRWGQRPAVWRGADPCGFREIFGLADVDRIISTAARPPTVRMVRDGVPLPTHQYCTPLRLGGKPVDDVVDPRKVTDCVRCGATLVLQSLHRTVPSVAEFVGDLQRQIGHPVQANAYLTPADAAGLAEHADAHDVIVLQLHGSKRWVLDGPDGSGPGDVEVSAGDSMYIPAGSRHRASTTGEASLHLTLGIVRVTYRDVLQRVLADGPDLLDRPLPIGYHDDGGPVRRQLECDTASMLHDVRRYLGGVDVARRVADEVQRRRRSPFMAGHLTSLIDRGEITLDSRLRWSAPRPLGRRAPSEPWCPLDALVTDDPRRDDRQLQVHLGDRVLTVPPVVLDAIRIVSGGDPVVVNDLPGLDPPSRIVLARRLVEETACVVERERPPATDSPVPNPR